LNSKVQTIKKKKKEREKERERDAVLGEGPQKRDPPTDKLGNYTTLYLITPIQHYSIHPSSSKLRGEAWTKKGHNCIGDDTKICTETSTRRKLGEIGEGISAMQKTTRKAEIEIIKRKGKRKDKRGEKMVIRPATPLTSIECHKHK